MEKTLDDFQNKWLEICNKIYPTVTLTDKEKVWYYTQCFIGCIDNGGIASFFYNHDADNYLDVMGAFMALNAEDITTEVIKISNLFPDEISNLDINQRNEVINNWPDGKYNKLFESVDSRLYELFPDLEKKLIRYIAEHQLA